MITLNLSLSDKLLDQIKAEAEADGFDDAGRYVEHLIRDHVKARATARLEALLIEGLDSGEPIEVDDEFWRKLREEASAKAKRSP